MFADNDTDWKFKLCIWGCVGGDSFPSGLAFCLDFHSVGCISEFN